MGPSSPVGGFKARGAGNAALDKHCYRHPSTPRETSCTECTRSVCRACVVLTPEGNYCPSCAADRRADLSRARVNVVVWTGLAVTMAAVAISLVPPAQTAADRVALHQAEMDAHEKAARTVNGRDYGPDTYTAVTLQKRLREGSCELEVARALADTQLKHKDDEGGLTTLLAFESRCGADARLLDLKSAAREAVGDLDGALRDARAMADAYPNAQQHYRVGRLLLKRADGAAEALQHLTRGAALNPTGTTLLLSLAQAQAATGDACGAAYTLHRLERAPGAGQQQVLAAQAGGVGGACATARAQGSVVVAPGGDPTSFRISSGGRAAVEAALDPTLAFLTLGNQDARRLGLTVRGDEPTVDIMLQGSVAHARLLRVPQLTLTAVKAGRGNLVLQDVDVAVVDAPPEDETPAGVRLGHNVLDRLDGSVAEDMVTWQAWNPPLEQGPG